MDRISDQIGSQHFTDSTSLETSLSQQQWTDGIGMLNSTRTSQFTKSSNLDWLPEVTIAFGDVSSEVNETAKELSAPELSVSPGELTTVSLNVGGMDRQYQVYVPTSYDDTQPLPVVYLLHGVKDGSPAGLMAAESALSQYAEERDFVAVYPLTAVGEDGLASWNSPGAGLTETDPLYDDVDYMRAVVDSVQNLGVPVDPDAQIIAGFSEGAEFSTHLVGEMPGVFTARASVHGTVLGTETRTEEGMPTVIVHGSDDEMLPWDGGMGLASWVGNVATGGSFERVKDSQPALQMDWALEANQCQGDPQLIRDVDFATFFDVPVDYTDHTSFSAEQCNGNPVDLYYIEGASHAWHGVGEGGIFIIGEKYPWFNATEAILTLLPAQ